MSSNQIDWQETLVNFGGDEELLKSVIEICFMELPRLIEQLQKDLESGQWTELSRNAHTVKGSVRHFGDTRAGAIARELESKNDESDVGQVRRDIEMLEVEVNSLLDEMRRFVGE